MVDISRRAFQASAALRGATVQARTVRSSPGRQRAFHATACLPLTTVRTSRDWAKDPLSPHGTITKYSTGPTLHFAQVQAAVHQLCAPPAQSFGRAVLVRWTQLSSPGPRTGNSPLHCAVQYTSCRLAQLRINQWPKGTRRAGGAYGARAAARRSRPLPPRRRRWRAPSRWPLGAGGR